MERLWIATGQAENNRTPVPEWPARLNKLGYMFRALQHRNYRLFFAGQTISLIGLWMTRAATLWLVQRLTGSPAMVGLVGFAQLAPSFFLAPLAGALMDRWNRHRALVATQVASMAISLALAVLALGGWIEVWHVLALCAAEGAVRGFDIAARQALLVELVEHRDNLPNAIALNSVTFNAARTVGPAVGAAIVWWVGEGLCFLIDGLSYFAVIAALLAMRISGQPPHREHQSMLRDIGEGLAHTFGFAPYRALLMLAGVVILMGGAPQMALMPEFAQNVLQGEALTYGILMGASGGGAFAGAVYLTTRRTVRGLGRVLAGCAVMFGVMTILFAMTRTAWLAAAVVSVTGFALMTLMAGSNTVMQTMVDEDKRGRVMSLFVMTFTGAAPLGQLLAGRVAEVVGAPWTLAGGGAVCVVAGLIFARQLPALRVLVRPIYIERGVIPEDAAGAGQPAGTGTQQ